MRIYYLIKNIQSSNQGSKSNQQLVFSKSHLSLKQQSNSNNQKQIMKLSKVSRYSSESVVLIATLVLIALLASIKTIECHIKRTQYHEQVSYHCSALGSGSYLELDNLNQT